MIALLSLLATATPLEHADQISAFESIGDNLYAVAVDEGTHLQIAELKNRKFHVVETINLTPDSDEEVDLEAIAYRSGHPYIYVVGSHAATRKKLKAKKTREENLKRLAKIKPNPSRQKLFRVNRSTFKVDSVSLTPLLRNHPVLKGFLGIPGKENGFNIEGMALSGGRLYLGLRSPVLREGYVPVIHFDPYRVFRGQDKSVQVRYLDLKGRGIRAMAATACRRAFVVVTGPSSNFGLDKTYEIYHWDGKDMIPGKHSQPGKLTLLKEVLAPEGGKLEALDILNGGPPLKLLLGFDGVDRTRVLRFKPRWKHNHLFECL